MFQLLGQPKDGVVALRITGEVSDRETDRIVSIVRNCTPSHGKARLVLLMEHYASFNSAESLYEDLRFVRRCGDAVERLAVIGDRSWKSTWIGLFGLFGGMDAAYFDREETEKAMQWLTKKPSA